MDEPDYELDAYLQKGNRRGPLCDVRLWLPKQPGEHGRIEVVAPGVSARQAAPGGPVSIVSDENGSFHFEAHDILVREARARLGAKAGGARLTIVHIGRVAIRHGPPIDGQRPWRVDFRLGALEYALPMPLFREDYRGCRTIDQDDEPAILEMPYPDGFVCRFALERHWHWTSKVKNGWTALARSTPCLSLTQVPEHESVSLTSLSDCADDAAMLLSLASRWRVPVHGFMATLGSDKLTSLEEWRSPLEPAAAHGLERAEGYLIASTALGDYFRKAALRFSQLDLRQRDAIRSAIVSMHSTSERTIEGAFLSMFFSLEGLARDFGKNSGPLAEKFAELLANHPIQIGGLWPVVGTNRLPGLSWLRNKLAHGHSLRKHSSAVLLASDHLQLWIEYALLAIFEVTSPR
jgi:hypothetical protein